MAEPQGLNVGAILTTGIVGTILTMAIVEGVRAYYNVYEAEETAHKWEVFKVQQVATLRDEQKGLLHSSSIPIDQAAQQVVAAGGKVKAK